MSILAGDNFVLVTYGDLVPIYPTAFATQPKLIIQQVDEVEAVYAFKVLDDSVFRFKVEIFEPDRCTYDAYMRIRKSYITGRRRDLSQII